MKKRTLAMLALATLPGGALLAQNIAGTWQGTIQIPNGPALRLVVKVTRAEDESLKAVMYSIDQNPTPLNASSMSQDGSTVKFAVAPLNAKYEGKLSADGNTINGTFTQGAPFPLNLARATPETAWTIPDPPPPPKAMAADANPSFEVATIKPSKTGERFSLLVAPDGRMNTTNTSLVDLIKFAYGVHPRQITGGPPWMESDKFDITAKPDTAGIPNGPQLRRMMQKLIEDRFALKHHEDKKEMSVYAITVAKGGPKMTVDTSNGNLPGFGGGPAGLVIRNTTMEQFAGFLQAQLLDQPVVDQTGLGETRYDFTLKFTPDAAQRGADAPGGQPAPADPDAPPDLFTAIQQQAGLKLQSAKAPATVFVVDKVEKPSDN